MKKLLTICALVLVFTSYAASEPTEYYFPKEQIIIDGNDPVEIVAMYRASWVGAGTLARTFEYQNLENGKEVYSSTELKAKGLGEWEIGTGANAVYKAPAMDDPEEPECTAKLPMTVAKLTMFEIKMITPKGNPASATEAKDSGDGQNEFTYDSASTGVLTMDLKSEISPSSISSDTKEKIKDDCKFTVVDIMGSTKAWNSANSGGKPTLKGSDLEATVKFTTLPTQNSSFGKKEAKVFYKGIKVIANDYEVFFNKTATNHPGGTTGNPNWFYYWKEGGVCSIPSTAKYNSNIYYGRCFPGTSTIIELGPWAPKTNTGSETFTKDDGTTSITVTGSGKGIKCVAETVVHEQNHLDT